MDCLGQTIPHTWTGLYTTLHQNNILIQSQYEDACFAPLDHTRPYGRGWPPASRSGDIRVRTSEGDLSWTWPLLRSPGPAVWSSWHSGVRTVRCPRDSGVSRQEVSKRLPLPVEGGGPRHVPGPPLLRLLLAEVRRLLLFRRRELLRLQHWFLWLGTGSRGRHLHPRLQLHYERLEEGPRVQVYRLPGPWEHVDMIVVSLQVLRDCWGGGRHYHHQHRYWCRGITTRSTGSY